MNNFQIRYRVGDYTNPPQCEIVENASSEEDAMERIQEKEGGLAEIISVKSLGESVALPIRLHPLYMHDPQSDVFLCFFKGVQSMRGEGPTKEKALQQLKSVFSSMIYSTQVDTLIFK